MGEVLDARYTIGKTFMLMAHDLATGRFYKDIAQNEDWAQRTEPAGAWADANEWSRRWRRFTGPGGIEWVKVPAVDIPDTGGKKRWGALSGMWVREEIWRDINELDLMQRPNFWIEMMTQWKLNKTARSPVVHTNNIMSNLAFMDMADVRLQDLVKGVNAYVRETADFKEAADNGAFGADMMSQEIKKSVLEPVLREIMQQAPAGPASTRIGQMGRVLGKIAGAVWDKAKAADRKLVDLYRIEDEVFRMAMYMRRRSLGETPQEAADHARRQFLDYDIRAPWVNAARRTALPFIAYTYRAAPIIAQSMATRPWKLAKYFLVAYAANALGYMIAGGDEDDERRSLRKQEQGYTWIGVPRMMRMPWRDRDGNPVFLDIRRWIPAGDIFDIGQGSTAWPLPAPLLFGGPLMMAAELMLNKKAFDGQPIINTLTDDIWDRTSKVGDWAWKSWMPGAAWVPGSWYWDKISNAIAGATSKTGAEASVPQAIASSVGVKVKSQDVQYGYYLWAKQFRREERDLKDQLKRIADRRARKIITEAQAEKETGAIARKFQNLGARMKETFQGKPMPAGQ